MTNQGSLWMQLSRAPRQIWPIRILVLSLGGIAAGHRLGIVGSRKCSECGESATANAKIFGHRGVSARAHRYPRTRLAASADKPIAYCPKTRSGQKAGCERPNWKAEPVSAEHATLSARSTPTRLQVNSRPMRATPPRDGSIEAAHRGDVGMRSTLRCYPLPHPDRSGDYRDPDDFARDDSAPGTR